MAKPRKAEKQCFTHRIKSSPVWRVTPLGYDRIEKSCADPAENKLRLRTLILKVGEWEFQAADPRDAPDALKKIISRRILGNITSGFASLPYVKAIVLSKIISAV